jgi:ribosomal-protein-alanine N-acetyltransferase
LWLRIACAERFFVEKSGPAGMITVQIPTIETACLRLRAPMAVDFDSYAAFRQSDRTRILGGPNPLDEAFHMLCALVGHWHIRGFGRWMVADKATDAPLGIVGLYHPDDWPEPEIGWSLFEAAEGKGVAFEAAMVARSYAYDVLGWSRIVSLIVPHNERSGALARRMGCVVEGQYTHPFYGPMDIWLHQPAGGIA